jgi:hypothetical protein
MSDEQWWYDLKSKSVVSDNNATKVTDRLGPYGSREEAEHALQKVDERNEQYDNDPRWTDD